MPDRLSESSSLLRNRAPVAVLQSVLDPITRGWLVVTAGSFGRLALGFVASVLIARALGPVDLGVYAVLGAIGMIYAAFAEFGLTQAAVKRIAPVWLSNPGIAAERAVAFVLVRILFAAVAVVLGVGLVLTLGVNIWKVARDHPWLLALSIIGAGFTALSGSMSGLLQALRQFGRLNVVMLTNAGLTALLAAVLFVLGYLNVTSAIIVLGIGTTIASSIAGWRMLPRIFRQTRPKANFVRSEASELFHFGKWVWLSNVLALVGTQLDVLLVNHWLSASATGHYALALSLASKADVLNQSLYAALMPVAASLRDAEAIRAYLRRSLIRSGLIALALAPLYILAGPLIRTIYGAEFRASVDLFRLLLAVAILDVFATPLLLIAFAARRPRILAGIDGSRTLTLLAAGTWLIPVLGASGAIIARAISRLVGIVIIVVWLGRMLRAKTQAYSNVDETSADRITN